MRDEDRRQLDRVSRLVREVLGEDVAGAYLFGSAVHGGLQPDSDLDVLVVSERHTTLDEKTPSSIACWRSRGGVCRKGAGAASS